MVGANAESVERVAHELKQTIDVSADARVIFIGDIHGCYDEVVELLGRVAPANDDVVISVGDVVTKGPSAARCLDLWRERGYLAVCGNNERKLLARAESLLRYVAIRDGDVLRRSDLRRYLQSWPLVIDIPSRRIAAVHGGFLPGTKVGGGDLERTRELLDHLRWIRKKDGAWIAVRKDRKKKTDVLWAERWDGDRFVLYGHTPLREPRRDPKALGLDTGCVYGGALTAAVHSPDGTWSLVSVKARRRYAS